MVNIFSDGMSFDRVKNAYVRLCAAGDQHQFEAKQELANYPLNNGNIFTRGLVFCRLVRR